MLSLRGAASDEAISVFGRDCFAEFILSEVEGLAMESSLYAMRWEFCPIVLRRFP
jgi:hypothetical protein